MAMRNAIFDAFLPKLVEKANVSFPLSGRRGDDGVCCQRWGQSIVNPDEFSLQPHQEIDLAADRDKLLGRNAVDIRLQGFLSSSQAAD
ncbi:hypothetical protein [Rhizobium leguminosarum]|uniref:hypothetical protein n=1 Tax=Rhizobium leguminosarum TaxID=384 RepID=UPI001C96B21C|nr:hypothetical protein [Rhizobium leguminosarum]MBY5439067.1 hypothetical protein [Rhizobium leguminosarum]